MTPAAERGPRPRAPHPTRRSAKSRVFPMLRKRLQGFDPIIAITVVLVIAALVALVLAVGAPAGVAG